MSSVPAGGQETQRVSEFFHAGSGGDVIFCSSDNVLFHVQHKFLETNAEGFPLTDHTPPSNEIVKLTESSSVLELFFRFAYPQMPPDLDDLDFKSLMEFAEAAEKYLLHHARKFCIIEMK
ncbi:hypothetical protein VKT23_016058 [Stygiomarasmius scandens]|uniref:BTB domain-containing protein n=1 Tax=Marasmiellus scandens TaxID=2682957 RepID=A0ABR1IYJ2_9AGAR